MDDLASKLTKGADNAGILGYIITSSSEYSLLFFTQFEKLGIPSSVRFITVSISSSQLDLNYYK